jgi:hypothetical protein
MNLKIISKNFLALICIIITLNITKLQSQDYDNSFLSLGIKLGYQWGDIDGFVYGFEASYIKDSEKFGKIGAVLDIDYCKAYTTIHLAPEWSVGIVGMDFGPTLLIPDKSVYDKPNQWGMSLNVFTLGGIIPFYDYSYFPSSNITYNQIGSYLKIPVKLTGSSSGFIH